MQRGPCPSRASFNAPASMGAFAQHHELSRDARIVHCTQGPTETTALRQLALDRHELEVIQSGSHVLVREQLPLALGPPSHA